MLNSREKNRQTFCREIQWKRTSRKRVIFHKGLRQRREGILRRRMYENTWMHEEMIRYIGSRFDFTWMYIAAL